MRHLPSCRSEVCGLARSLFTRETESTKTENALGPQERFNKRGVVVTQSRISRATHELTDGDVFVQALTNVESGVLQHSPEEHPESVLLASNLIADPFSH